MNFQDYARRTCTTVLVVPAKIFRSAFVLTTLGALVALGCHTWQGVKEDTHRAVQETGRGLEKAGKKLEGSDQKKSADLPANNADAGAPP